MRSLFALVLLPTLVTLASAEPDETPVDVSDEDVYSEAAVLKKQRIPMPPSQDRQAYLQWRTKLPKATQKKIDRHCRQRGGEFQAVCNGIGPFGIPVPPSLMTMPSKQVADRHPPVADPEITHAAWQASLSRDQRRYYKWYCEPGDEDRGFSQLCGGTPIVLAFGGDRVEYAATAGAATDWPTATTPWLARDVDGDGAITSSAELFGSDTILPDGSLARHGFEGLAPLDDNRDGVLDGKDHAFASLLVWADRDGDRQSTPSELTRLSDTVVSLALAYRRAARCDVRGNCEGERSSMQWRDSTGALRSGSAIDVYLRYR